MITKLINIKLLLITSILISGCLSYPSNKVKLNEFPEYKSVDDLNIRVVYESDYKSKRRYKIKKNDIEYQDNKQSPVKSKDGCILDYYHYIKTPYSDANGLGSAYYIISVYTATLIPYYQPRTYGIKGKLIDAKTDNILNEYEYSERASRINSLPVFLLAALNPFLYDKVHTPEYASKMVKEKIEEALVRQVTNDAHNFKECKK